MVEPYHGDLAGELLSLVAGKVVCIFWAILFSGEKNLKVRIVKLSSFVSTDIVRCFIRVPTADVNSTRTLEITVTLAVIFLILSRPWSVCLFLICLFVLDLFDRWHWCHILGNINTLFPQFLFLKSLCDSKLISRKFFFPSVKQFHICILRTTYFPLTMYLHVFL